MKHRKAYLLLNLMYYGLVVLGMLYVAFLDPSLQEQLLGGVGQSLGGGPLATVAAAYLGGNVVVAAVLTFLVNLLAGALLVITLPSLIVPFAGIFLGGIQGSAVGLAPGPDEP